MPPLDARLEAQKLKEIYASDASQHSLKVLVIGEKGVGKTRLLRTARFPVHIDSFDPGGTQVLNDLIDKGDIVADVKYEREDRLSPWAYAEWRRTFETRLSGKYFESFGTYCLDSCTTWSDAIMNHVLKGAKDPQGKPLDLSGKAPRRNHDYVPQKAEISNYLYKILALPCDVIVTGHTFGVFETHIGKDNEEQQVLTGYRFMSTGKGTVIIPLLFSELWVAMCKPTSSGGEFTLLTRKEGLYLGSTRLGKEGKFNAHEPSDIKHLLRKAGWPTGDKPKLY